MRRTLAILTLGVVLGALLVPRLPGAHTPPGATTRIHHGATALLWLDRHHKGIPRPLLRRSRAQHEALFYAGMRARGLLGAFLCVKSHEGAWTSATGNGYYGGLQADLSFQRAYGAVYMRRWGTANNWPKWAQLHMGYRGWLKRGFHPWPNTARYCGLL